MSRFQTRHGFSAVECLVVAAVVGIMVALLLPAVQQAREAARRTECRNHLHNLALGLHNYHDVHDVFPPGWTPPHPADSSGADSWAWSVALLPYLE